MPKIYGEQFCKVDAKGRVMFPMNFRKAIPNIDTDGLIVNRAFEKGLIIYDKTQWAKIEQLLDKLDYFKAEHRIVIRYMSRSATQIKLDSIGRLLIPKQLLTFSGIQSECVFSGIGDRIELFSEVEYQEKYKNEKDTTYYADLAEKVLGSLNQDDDKS